MCFACFHKEHGVTTRLSLRSLSTLSCSSLSIISPPPLSQRSATTVTLYLSSATTTNCNIEQVLAPDFRFHPTDEELFIYYLKCKVCRKPFKFNAISEFNIDKSQPWDLAVRSRWVFKQEQVGGSSKTEKRMG